MKKLLFLVLTICLGAALPVFAGDGLCLYERFLSTTGGADSMLLETATPDYTELLTSSRIDPAVDNYRARFTFWLTPMVTGEYQFRIAVDDDMRIWLSPDANPDHARLIESRNGAKGINTFDASDQYSTWMSLEAGKMYWLRTGMREGTGGDHMNLQWQGPGFGWQNISGPVMSSTYPIDVEWGGERVVEFDVWAQTAEGFNAPAYTNLGYSNAAFPPLQLVLDTEGDPSNSGYISKFGLTGTGAPADYFVTRERAILKLDAATLLGLGISTDDGGQLYAGDWWTWAGAPETPVVANNDGLHGMRWRGGAIEAAAGYVGIETWQYEHGGGEGLDVNYWIPGAKKWIRSQPRLPLDSAANLVSRVEVSMHSPVNGALDMPLDTVLSWEPRFGAEAGEQVKVYIWEQGASKGGGVMTTENSYDPDLAMNKVYWWQVNTFEPNDLSGYISEVAGKKLAFGTVTSDVVITAQPQGAGVDLGGSLELSVAATSAILPLSYQWKKDGADIGANQPTHTITGMARSDNGVYSCVVSNGTASSESAGARVYLKELVAYWPLDGDLADHAEDIDPAAIGDKDAVFAVNDPNLLNPNDDPDATVPYVTGRVGSALDFNGQNNFAYAGTWNPTEASGRMTIEFWTRWDGDEGHWAGPIGKRDTWNSAEMMWQIEIDNDSDRLETLQSNGGGGGYATIQLPSSVGTNVAAGAIITASAQHPTNRDEAAWRAFDGRDDTKWLAFYNTAWLQATFADKKAYAVTSYSITSGNDAQDRDPDDWTLQGSNDGENWDILDTQVGQAGLWTGRRQTVSFTLSNTTAYRMYRLDVTKIRTPSANIIQLSEVRLFAADALGANAWVLITMVYDGSAATIYVNGLPIATQGMSLDGDTTASLVFGACEANPTGGPAEGSKPWGGNLYGGAMDEVKIYNYPLSAVEVMQNYYAVADGDPICIAGTQPEMDQDGNCVVDVADLMLLVNQWLLDNNTN
jgi:hypothetical protein